MIAAAKIAFATAGLLMLAGPAAHADCAGEIQRMQGQVTKVTDPKVKRLVEFDIKRATREADEGDGGECKEAIDHADKLMASAAPTP